MKKMYKNEQGFTLIELMIVIIILGVLAVIGIPKLMKSKEQAWAKACLTNRASLEDAGERYQFDVGVYPTTGDGNGQPELLKAPEKYASTWKGPYIKRTYYCPASTSTDTYSFGTVDGATKDAADGSVACSMIGTDAGDHTAK